jgi:hypothetical protein
VGTPGQILATDPASASTRPRRAGFAAHHKVRVQRTSYQSIDSAKFLTPENM